MDGKGYGFIGRNILEIRKRINEAASEAGREASDVTIVAVTKTVALPMIREAVSLGITELGENRVQEMLTKSADLTANWHLIGHLQTNKVKYVVGNTEMIHSVDSLKLGMEINRKALERGVVQDILVEVNLSGEETKFGVSSEGAKELIKRLWEMEAICVKGLMTVAPYVDEGEKNRDLFKNMRHLFIDINDKRGDNEPMKHLSMGMTGDYETAVSEGATIVRIGTGIFGVR